MRKALLVIAVALALPATALAQGTTRDIATGDDFFDPEIVSSQVGSESFRWAWTTNNLHNVVQDDRLFSSGGPTTNDEFTLTPSAGTFGYYCQIHGLPGGGMAGSLRIKPTAAVSGNRATLVWATPETDSGNQFDVRQRVGKKKPRLVAEKTKAFDGSFRLKPGRNQFQVRSQRGKATSAWSPKLTLKG